MQPEKIKLPEEPIAEHKNAIPTNYKSHLDNQQQDPAAVETVQPGKENPDTAKTNQHHGKAPDVDPEI